MVETLWELTKDLDAYIKDEQAEMLASTQKTIREAKLDIPCGQ